MRTKQIWILTLFPEYFEAYKTVGVIGKALSGEREDGIHFEFNLINIRSFSDNNYKSVDDYAYGGGAGMVMRADILANALLKGTNYSKETHHVVFPSPRGRIWNNDCAKDFAKNYLGKNSEEKDIVFICGRYEGIDERFLENYVNEYYSLGDFILSGGEVATMAMLDSALRFVDGILGNRESNVEESFQSGLLEHPQYTKPREFEGKEVPKVLISGHHKNIETYKQNERERLTKELRPDLWEQYKSE